MTYQSVNNTNPGFLQNEVDYDKVVGVYPVTYNDSVPYTAYPSVNPQKPTTYEYVDSTTNYTTYNFDNDIIDTNNNIIETNNIIDTTGYQTSYQTNDLNNIITTEYTLNSSPVEYTYDVTNNYTGSTNDNFITEVRDSLTNLETKQVPYSSSSYNRGSSRYSSSSPNYNINSLPADISPEMLKNAETEIIPVEEIEYIPIKTKKYIKRTKIKVPVKKTVVVPKKVVIPVIKKVPVYVQKNPNLVQLTPLAYQVPQKKIPMDRHMLRSSSEPNYKPRVYKRRI